MAIHHVDMNTLGPSTLSFRDLFTKAAKIRGQDRRCNVYHGTLLRRLWLNSASLSDIRQKRHEAGTLDGILDSALKGGTIATALAAKQLALAGAELLETLHVFVIDESGPRAPFLGTEPAAILAAASELFPNHLFPRKSCEIA
jgi:hypothetical protein